MWCVCPKLDCASLSFITSLSYIKATVHSDAQQKGTRSWAQSKCPAATSFLELHLWRRGERGKKMALSFKGLTFVLNEFPTLLMLRGGRASKRGSIDSEIMSVCISSVFLCECVLHHGCTWLPGGRTLNGVWNEQGQRRRGSTWRVGSPEIALATHGASPSSMSQRVIRLFSGVSWLDC